MRLRQGRMHDATVYSDDPVSMAKRWADCGCRRLHIVDLDGGIRRSAEEPGPGGANRRVGARHPRPDRRRHSHGGNRARLFRRGRGSGDRRHQGRTGRRFLPTMADAFPGRVLFGLDARNGKAATEGWDLISAQSALDLAARAGTLDLAGIVYTDIERDGMLSGLNVEATLELATATPLPVIASGGTQRPGRPRAAQGSRRPGGPAPPGCHLRTRPLRRHPRLPGRNDTAGHLIVRRHGLPER